jgi:hypothetical protein
MCGMVSFHISTATKEISLWSQFFTFSTGTERKKFPWLILYLAGNKIQKQNHQIEIYNVYHPKKKADKVGSADK